MAYLLAITGGSGSGKTTVSSALSTRLPFPTKILSYDNYYKNRTDLTFEERTKVNYDSPDAFDSELFLSHLRCLKEGKAIEMPVYDFATHLRKEETVHFEPSDIILVEGIMVLHLPKECFDYAIFVACDSDVRLARRVLRDVKERGRSAESVIAQYMATVKPSYVKYIRPVRKKADFIFDNTVNTGLDQDEIERLLEALKDVLK